MSVQNPFQIPSCFKLDIEQRRRERFKKAVIAAVIAVVILLAGLLIQGCVSEHSQAKAAAAVAKNVETRPCPALPAPRAQIVEVQSKPVSVPQLGSSTQPRAAVSKQNAAAVASHSKTGETVYIVKSGDTLTRIAKVYGTTTNAIKSANNLASDRIIVGAKLKIPTA
jgi:LysM repeat protein